jgi:hypothetical protein
MWARNTFSVQQQTPRSNSRPCHLVNEFHSCRETQFHYHDHNNPTDPPHISTSHPFRCRLLLGLRRLSLRFKRIAEFCTDPVSYA